MNYFTDVPVSITQCGREKATLSFSGQDTDTGASRFWAFWRLSFGTQVGAACSKGLAWTTGDVSALMT